MRVVLFWYVSKTAPSPASMYTAVYTYVRMSCFFWVGILQFFVRTYLVCVASSRPILLVRTSFHTVFSCDNNSVFITLHSEHQQLFWWDVSTKVPSAASMYTAVYSYMCRAFFSFFWGWDLALYCTYVPRVCCVIPCPILLVRTSYHTVFSCDNNSVFITLHSEQHQLLWWDVSKK